jgi:DNA-binding transcriptional regulator YiaG
LEKENPIEQICEDLGVNQKKLAEIIGVSKNSLSNWKNGKQQIPFWATKIFELLRIEKEFNDYKKFVSSYKLIH